MLKMIKYEMRRNLFPYLLMASALLFLEVLFGLGVFLKNNKLLGVSAAGLMLFGFAGLMFVAVHAIQLYSKDLKNKVGYMVFTTPLPSYKVLGAKILSAFASSFFLLLFYVGVGVLDAVCLLYGHNIPQLELSIQFFLGMDAFTFVRFLQYVLWSVFQTYCFLAVIICFGYFSLSLSYTLLQNKKGKNFISNIIFIVLFCILTYVGGKFFAVTVNADITKTVIESLPGTVFELFCALAAFLSAAYMLDRKINL